MSKIKQIQIGEDTYDLGVNASNIDGTIGGTLPQGGTQGQVLIKNSATDYDTTWGNVSVSDKATFLGSVEDYNSSNNALDLDELAEGLYILYFPRYTSTVNLYYKITINGTTYQYALGFDDYDGNKAFTIDHTIYLWMVNNIKGKTITSDTDIVRILISNVKPSIPRLDVYEKRIIARTSGVMVVNGEQENIINLATTDTAQTISAKKTFTTLPESSVVPTTDNQLVNKKYVDDNAGGSKTYYLDLTSLYYTVRDTNNSFNISDQTILDTLSSIRTDLSNGEKPIIYFKWKYEILRFGSWMTPEVVAPAYYYDNYGTWIIQVDNNYNCGWGAGALPSNYASLAIWTSNSSSSLSYTEYHSNYRYALIDEVPTNALTTNNTTSYAVTNDYNPAHKKYVDDAIADAITNTLGGSI